MLMRLGPSSVVLAAFAAVNGRHATASDLLDLAGLLCAALMLLTLLGLGAGRLARDNAEVHLFGALATGMLAVLSGVAPLPERLARLTGGMAWNPIARLLMALDRLATGRTAAPAAELVFSSVVLGAVVAAAILRWMSGGTRETGRSKARDVVPDGRACMEVQAK